MRDSRRRLWACALFVVSSVTVAGAQQQRARGPDRARVDRVAAAGGVIASVDSDGVPKFIWAAGRRPGPASATSDGAARWHLRRFARALDVTPSEVDSTSTLSVTTLSSGDVIVELQQQLAGVDVLGSEVKVLMRGDHELVALSGRPRTTGDAQLRFDRSPQAALAAALSDRTGLSIPASTVDTVTMPGGEQRFHIAANASLHMSEAAPVRAVMFPDGGRLVAAYVTEFYAGRPDSPDADAYRYVIAADDGRVLDRRDLTVRESRKPPTADPPAEFTYRVYAEPATRRPLDGPQINVSPHPTGNPDGTLPPFVPSFLVRMGGFNNPSTGLPDPWLAPDATETIGNNADAYVDLSSPDGFTPGTDFRANVTSVRSFDRIFDHALGPVATTDQSKAAITNVFYTVNWLHDYWYDSGFDEAAGNAQLSNYGRGGAEGDPMRVEVQDNFLIGARNNANMSTPSDGLRPRMQLYTFFGPQAATLTLTPGGSVPVGTAAFGALNFTINALVSLANDGTGTPTDACEPLSGVAGRIVLVDRGVCAFALKALNVQNAGGVGMIVANNVAGPAPGLGGVDPTITIGVLSISQADGVALKASLTAAPVTARMFRLVGIERDSALDNTIIAHEWGHYIHHRLADCGAQQCRAMSEGWGDFVALHTIAREEDNLNGVFGLATYSTSAFDPNSAYFGIRRVPYSVDFTKNALTLKHIGDGVALPAVPMLPGGPNSEVHNAGEIWTSMLWEAYVALLKSRGPRESFADVRRRMADYIVAGLKLAPTDATYTEQRDAILGAAAAARDDESDHGRSSERGRKPGRQDLLVLANAFARRGAGTCAVSPPRDSATLTGVVESFEVQPRAIVGEIQLEEDKSCDRDGFLDGGERGTLVVPVMNGGPIALLNTIVSVSIVSPASGVSFKHGRSLRIGRIAPFDTHEARFEIEVDRNVVGIGQLELTITIQNEDACEPVATRTFASLFNVDDAPGTSNVDNVESPATQWTLAGVDAGDVWSRVEVAPLNHAWLGADIGRVSDTTLTSPALHVGTSAPFVIAFDHRFSFESDGGVAPFFDGGVIEISSNGGPFVDISTVVDPGYGGTLFVGSDNPLGGRPAFVGRSSGFPARQRLTLDLGTAFAGQTVRIRFRIATDAGAGDLGWELDNLEFLGITNLPFSTFVADLNKCRGVPKKK